MLERLIQRVPLLGHLDRHMQEVLSKGFLVSILRVAARGLGFLFSVVIARLFGAEGTGLYYLALAVAMVAMVIGRLGLDNVIVRFVASNATQKNWPQVAGVYRQSMWLSGSLSFFVAVFIFITAPWVANVIFSNPDLTAFLRIMSFGIAPGALVILHAQALMAVGRPAIAAVVQATGISFLNILLIYPLSHLFSLRGLAATYAITQVALLLVGWLLWRHVVPQIRGVRGRFDHRVLIRTALPLLWVASANLIMQWTDTFMLGIWTTPEDVGIYGVVVRTATLTSFILIAVNSVVAPKFAAMYAERDSLALGRLARDVSRLASLLGLPFLAVLTVFSQQVLSVFGPEFIVGAAALIILSIGQFINVATGSVGYLLMMTGHEKAMQHITIGAALLNILLNVLLIPILGILGAAISTASSLALMNIVGAILVHKKLAILTVPIPGKYFWR